MDFFEHVNENLSALNRNERKLLDYIIRNIREVAGKSIREVAQDNYVSTTTILRLTKKLGFNGYRDFSDSLKIALYTRKETKVPRAIQRDGYSEEYLKNIIESIRVLSPKAVSKFEDALKKKGDLLLRRRL